MKIMQLIFKVGHKVIKNDPNEIYRAAADAEKAMSYIETRMINKNLTKD